MKHTQENTYKIPCSIEIDASSHRDTGTNTSYVVSGQWVLCTETKGISSYSSSSDKCIEILSLSFCGGH